MEWLGSIASLLALAAILGGVAAVFYANRSKSIIELLKTENSAYKESNERLHTENIELKHSYDTCNAELKVWRNNITQGPSIEKLIAANNKQHSENIKGMVKVTKGLNDLVQQQSKLTEAIINATKIEGINGSR